MSSSKPPIPASSLESKDDSTVAPVLDARPSDRANDNHSSIDIAKIERNVSVSCRQL